MIGGALRRFFVIVLAIQFAASSWAVLAAVEFDNYPVFQNHSFVLDYDVRGKGHHVVSSLCPDQKECCGCCKIRIQIQLFKSCQPEYNSQHLRQGYLIFPQTKFRTIVLSPPSPPPLFR